MHGREARVLRWPGSRTSRSGLDVAMESIAQTAPVIETLDLSKTYSRFVALHELSISVPKGSVFALMGASGAGKTTVIKILLNIISPTRGRATILGVESRAIDATTLDRIGYVSENQTMPGRLRVADFFTYLRPCYANWDRNLEDELRAQLALPPNRKIGELSHGMRMKMALACALPFRPKLLVLDEPLSGLDPLARDGNVAGFMHQAGQTTILISSHELDEVERFATHVAFLHEGQLLFQGSVDALAGHARPLFLNEGPRSRRTPVAARYFCQLMVRAARRSSCISPSMQSRLSQTYLKEGLEAFVADGRFGRRHSGRPRMGGIPAQAFSADLPAAEALAAPRCTHGLVHRNRGAHSRSRSPRCNSRRRSRLVDPTFASHTAAAGKACLSRIDDQRAHVRVEFSESALAIGMPVAASLEAVLFKGRVHFCMLHRSRGRSGFDHAQHDQSLVSHRRGSGISILVERQPRVLFSLAPIGVQRATPVWPGCSTWCSTSASCWAPSVILSSWTTLSADMRRRAHLP